MEKLEEVFPREVANTEVLAPTEVFHVWPQFCGGNTVFTSAIARQPGARQPGARQPGARQPGAVHVGTGLILVGSDGRVRIATERACEMLEIGDRDRSEMAPLVDEVIAAVGSEDGSGELEWAERPLRVTLTSYEEEEETWRLLELRDRRSHEDVQTSLLLAARVDNLMRLVVGLAHDLKAPLNAIMLHLELLQRTLEPGAPTRADRPTPAQRVGIIDSELKRLQRGLELLLGQAVPVGSEDRPFDLRRAVLDIGDLLEGPARLDGKIVEVEKGDREAMVDMKKDHVTQALLNVAINGLEAMSQGGHLHLRVEHAEERVRVEISDTGPGVDAEIRSRLFEIYVTGKTSGVGAGLYMARLLLESQGGSIELTSTSSAGTTFTIELPVVAKH